MKTAAHHIDRHGDPTRVDEHAMKTLASLTEAEWDGIRDMYGVSKVLIWRASTAAELELHRGRPVGMRRLTDGTYEVQINYDSFRRRPQSVHIDEFTLYSLYRALAKIELGQLDEESPTQWRALRLKHGGQSGIKTHVIELDKAASDWALDRMRGNDKSPALLPRRHDMVQFAAA